MTTRMRVAATGAFSAAALVAVMLGLAQPTAAAVTLNGTSTDGHAVTESAIAPTAADKDDASVASRGGQPDLAPVFERKSGGRAEPRPADGETTQLLAFTWGM